MFKQQEGFPLQVNQQKSTSQSYWQSEVNKQQNNPASAVVGSRGKLSRRMAESSSVRAARDKIRASTGIGLDNVEVEIDEQLQGQGKRAVAESGKIVRFASESDAQDDALALHEMIHIAQQRGGNAKNSQPVFTEEQAEQESEQLIKKVRYRQPVRIARTNARCLYQGTTAHKGTSEKPQKEARVPPLGQGVCVVFYLDIGDVAFTNTAARHIQERPNRCYAWRNGKVEQNQGMPFRTGMDIVEGIKHIASVAGKISEVYILSHGYSGGILTLNTDGTEYSTEHGLSASTEPKAPKTQGDTNAMYSSSEVKTFQSKEIGRSVGDVKAIAKDCLMPNVTFVIHACRSSGKPFVGNNINKNKHSFNEALYLALQDELGQDVSVYGHQGTTKAGYNCAWHKHSYGIPAGEREQAMPSELLAGSYIHCRSEDLKDGEVAQIARNPQMTKRRH